MSGEMNGSAELERILLDVRGGALDVADAQRRIASLLHSGNADAPAVHAAGGDGRHEDGDVAGALLEQRVADLGFAQLDLDRQQRTGFPEVIFGEGKTVEQITAIFRRLAENADRVLATRVSPDKAEAILAAVPGAIYHETARCVTWFKRPILAVHDGYIAVVCAGTSDLPVAEEAAVTAECMGSHVEKVYDVGVAGIHRLLRRLPVIREANVIVVVAGMEGALASVVGGLVAKPVVAVPTSVGYGASFGGLSALLTMLNSCATGVSVVNIDNGFGAGYFAGLINQNRTKR
ncbi:nickel pincer cofactor biosynthesis protein LarB [Gordoniibacillus kamchatkensis]|nr:nickel pincer cofactor biosynthesis protein LarB [Paenibacillus sp. VKM B-2647]